MHSPKDLDNYVIFLAEKMRKSAKNLPDPDQIAKFDSENLAEPEEFKTFVNSEKYIHGVPKPISEITGIGKQLLPPLKELNDAQAAILIDEIQRLLKAYRFFPVFPEKLPDHIKYRLLFNIWNEKMVYLGTGQSYIEFCTYQPEQCPFPDNYCQCQDIL